MPTSAMEDDSSALPGRKRAASSALQLGPRKKVCAIVINPIFLTVNLFYIRTTQDPLVHHGRHFGRTVHAFCNVQTLVTNGLQAMCDDAPEDDSLTSVYVAYFLNKSTILTCCSERKERAVFRELLQSVPGLENRLMTSSEEEVVEIADQVRIL